MQLQAELAYLTRRLAELDAPTPLVGDEVDRAVANEAYELLGRSRERMAARVRDLASALDRLKRGVYGTCELCRKPIAPARLQALPAAAFCRDCQASIERDAAALR
jgi:RNA polymerase-binding protein DksA